MGFHLEAVDPVTRCKLEFDGGATICTAKICRSAGETPCACAPVTGRWTLCARLYDILYTTRWNAVSLFQHRRACRQLLYSV